MNIKKLVENVVHFGGGTTQHRYAIDVNGVRVHENLVHLSNDPKLQRSQISQHIANTTAKLRATFPEHLDGPLKINDAHEIVNHIRAHQWFDHDDQSRSLQVKHKFIPVE